MGVWAERMDLEGCITCNSSFSLCLCSLMRFIRRFSLSAAAFYSKISSHNNTHESRGDVSECWRGEGYDRLS